MAMNNNGIRTILALMVLAGGAGWIAHSVISHGGKHHIPANDAEADEITGSGTMVTVDRPIGDVHAIVLDGTYKVTITVGPAAAFRLTADDNVAPLIEARTEDGELTVSSHRDFTTDHHPSLAISLPSLDRLKLETSSVTITGLKGARFDLTIEGASEVEASGAVEASTIEVDGAGRLNLRSLQVGDMTLRMDGAGAAEVTATQSLDVRIDGAGAVSYAGNPAHVTRKIDGFGHIGPAT
jgi:hypothetical protein